MKYEKDTYENLCCYKGEIRKRDLIRVVRTPVGEVEIDLTGKMNGRGAYIKKDINVIEKAKKLRFWKDIWK